MANIETEAGKGPHRIERSKKTETKEQKKKKTKRQAQKKKGGITRHIPRKRTTAQLFKPTATRNDDQNGKRKTVFGASGNTSV